MFATLIQKEIHDSLISLRFIIALILCMILVPVGMYVNLKDYEKRLHSYNQSLQIYQQDHPNERSVSRGGAKGFREPSLFSIFSVGLEYHLPTTVHSDPDDGISLSNDRGVNNPHSMLFGKIDLLFNVSVVISLLAILFTFGCVAGEKEAGTLKLTLANTVPRHTILAAKFFGNFIVLIIPLFLSLLIGLLILTLSGQAPLFSGDHLLKFFLMILASLLLIAAFFNLGMLVSSLTQRSTTAIVLLLLIWVFMTLAFPRISTMIAEVIRPVKSGMVLTLEKQALLKSMDLEERTEYTDLWERVSTGNEDLETHADSSRWNASTRNFMEERVSILQKYADRRKSSIAQLETEHDNEKRRQSAIAMNISRLSPVSCYTYAMSAIAGTGLMEEPLINDGARRFDQDLQERVYSQVFIVKRVHSTSSSSNFQGDNPPPQLQISKPSIGDVLGAMWLDLLLLVLFNILLFSGAHVAFLRYDVR